MPEGHARMSREESAVSTTSSVSDDLDPSATTTGGSSAGADKMSVFSDFQRMWIKRFPQSSLSDAWELDVRASLQRHKQKIADLSKELEQEQLYVEYLERLLNDVEKHRETGGDPAAVIDSANPPAYETEKNSTTPSSSSRKTETPDDVDPEQTNGQEETVAQSITTGNDAIIKQDGGAMHQCINELSTSLHRTESPDQPPLSPTSTTDKPNPQAERIKSVDSDIGPTKKPASHFVTVIEVKEMLRSEEIIATSVGAEEKSSSIPNEVAEVEVTEKFVSAPLAAVLEAKKKIPPRPPPKNIIRRAAPVEPPTVPAGASINHHLSPSFSSSSTPLKSVNESTATPSQPHSSSLDRNVKPSDILRQKSSDSLDMKHSSNHRNTNPDLARQIDLADELGRKIGKAESFERNRRPDPYKRNQSPTEFSSSPTGSLSKVLLLSGSPNGSLGKVIQRANDGAGSRESLSSQGPISQRIKSYESISSISSDNARHVGQQLHPAHIQPLDHEPYYDTVPMDNGGSIVDGEYVYIQAGGNGSSASSRDDISHAGSTLPMSAAHAAATASNFTSRSHPISFSSQSSILTEPESPGRSSNYVNLDYFLTKSHGLVHSNSQDSDGESDGKITISHSDGSAEQLLTPGMRRKNPVAELNRSTSVRHIINNIIESEESYVECLNKMMQYMKAIRATLATSQPVITQEEFDTIFFKINELHQFHTKFLQDLRSRCDFNAARGDIFVGEPFREMAAQTSLYVAFIHNYGRAIETVKKCGSNNQQFKEIVARIVVNPKNEQSLEDLLHKPVARVQKNDLVLVDLIEQTPQNHPDYQPLRKAQKTIRNFLSELNHVSVSKNLIPSDDKALRRLVKNSVIVELADNHRKLRHLFLFNDVIACAKYKASGGNRFEYELKWFIPLRHICVLDESSAADPKENSPVNLLQLKSQACTVRDQILLESRDDKKQRSGDKHRKKLHDLEAQLVLASPNLVFRINNRATNKTNVFFLSSDYERTLWIDSIMSLQQSCNLPGAAQPMHIYELQAWISACQEMIATEMGSYLMRNSRDESLLVGDLDMSVQGLTGLDHAGDYYVCIEVDSYGHYFRKARTKLVCRSASPLWNQTFILELEGSQNVRVLLYEDKAQQQILVAKHVIKLSRRWLLDTKTNKPLQMTDTIVLNTALRFIPGEETLRRVPSSKPGALFGAKIQQVLKREKRKFPFILSACIREVERRGMSEVGIYRVSGSASDTSRLRKSFETNNYEAEQLLKEVDIHSVTGVFKAYLRELPEALFTDQLYPKLSEVFNSAHKEDVRISALNEAFAELPEDNRLPINFILDHLIRINQQEAENKMSLHNLAMVFGPTLLRPGANSSKQKDLLESSTVDVMAQAGILYCFLQTRNK